MKPVVGARIYSKKGFGLVESLLGLALMGLISYTFANIFGIIGKGTQRVRANALMVKLESSILAALESPETFKDVQTKLKDGTLGATGFTLTFLGVDLAKYKEGEKLSKRFDVNTEKECSSPLLPSCSVRVDFALKKTGIAPPFRWGFAYRVAYDPIVAANIPIRNLGVQSPGPEFDLNTDFLGDIPLHYYLSSGTSTACPPEHLMVGFDLVQSRAKCVVGLASDQKCLEGQMAKGVKIKTYADPSVPKPKEALIVGEMELNCIPMRKISCKDDNYGLYAFKPQYFDPTYPAVPGEAPGSCKFLGVKSFDLKLGPGEKKFCPPTYQLSADATKCVLKVAEDTSASKGCPSHYKEDEYGECIIECTDAEIADGTCDDCDDGFIWNDDKKLCTLDTGGKT